MREILFRGKRKDNGEWEYGSFVQLNTVNGIEYTIVMLENFSVEVAPETVGQYTGLKDCNGKEIYEGDIVRVLLHGNPQPIGIVKYGERGICLYTVVTEASYSNYLLDNPKDFEVIGNIHDNPELY